MITLSMIGQEILKSDPYLAPNRSVNRKKIVCFQSMDRIKRARIPDHSWLVESPVKPMF